MDVFNKWGAEMKDTIYREDAIKAVWKPQVKPNELIFDALKTAIESEINNVPSADRPSVDKDYLISLIQEAVYDGEACARLMDMVDRPQGDVDAVDIFEREMHNLEQGYITLGEFDERIEPLRHLCYGRPQGEWIPCSERLPETDGTNEINEFDVLLVVRPKKHPEKTPQVYIGKLRPVEGDDGSGNFWGVKIAPCEWTIWGWSYFQEPEVLAWMPIPKPWEGADDVLR
jgi:hypothetical protein